jgi:translation initiation factor 1A
LLSLRDFQDNKADVLYKYSPDEARALKAQKEIPEGAKINEMDQNGPEDGEDLVQFENDENIDDVRLLFIFFDSD